MLVGNTYFLFFVRWKEGKRKNRSFITERGGVKGALGVLLPISHPGSPSFLFCSMNFINNYWMSLSMVWRIMHIDDAVISINFHIIQKFQRIYIEVSFSCKYSLSSGWLWHTSSNIFCVFLLSFFGKQLCYFVFAWLRTLLPFFSFSLIAQTVKLLHYCLAWR